MRLLIGFTLLVCSTAFAAVQKDEVIVELKPEIREAELRLTINLTDGEMKASSEREQIRLILKRLLPKLKEWSEAEIEKTERDLRAEQKKKKEQEAQAKKPPVKPAPKETR